MIAITVSTNYSDILPFTLEANLHHFKKWIFVTDVNDKATIEILSKIPKVIILYWDFQNGRRQFDKGGAVMMAQKFVYDNWPLDWYLIIDSDICLSHDFTINTDTLNPSFVYGASYRHDFYKLSDYKNNINFYNCPTYNFPLGFFQLYNEKHFYQQSNSAASCDDQFINRHFQKRVFMLNHFVCNHLGKNEVNWYGGRKTGSDFIID